MMGYSPLTLADLAGRIGRTAEVKVRWKLVWEFLEEYRWEPPTVGGRRARRNQGHRVLETTTSARRIRGLVLVEKLGQRRPRRKGG